MQELPALEVRFMRFWASGIPLFSAKSVLSERPIAPSRHRAPLCCEGIERSSRPRPNPSFAPMHSRWLLCLFLFCTLLTTPGRANENSAGAPPAADTPKEPTAHAPSAPPSAEVRLGTRVLLRLRSARHGKSAQARAQAATRAIDRALHHPGPREVRVRWVPLNDPKRPDAELARLYIDEALVLELTPTDHEATGTTDDARTYVQNLSMQLTDALDEEQHRMQIADWVLASSSVIFLGLLGLWLLRSIGRWSRAVLEWTHREGATIGAVQVASIDLIPAAAVREALRVGIVGGSWIMRLALVYFWAIWSLSLFDVTRPLAGSATASLLGPLGELIRRIASQIPVVVALLVSLFVVGLLMRFIAAYFRAIERGDLTSDWADPATARVTGGLLLIALTLLTLLFLAPFVTGAKDGVFSQLGMLSLGALALSTSPLMVSCALGVRLVYSRTLHLGDELGYGGSRGLVRQIGLFDVILEPSEGGIIRVPHLMSLWHATRVFNSIASPPGAAISQAQRDSIEPAQQDLRTSTRAPSSSEDVR